MKLDVRELKNDYMNFVVEGTSTPIMNPIRRILIAELPKMAIEEVEFHLGPIRDENGKEFESVSPLFDEIIAHRLGLLPIPTDLKLFGFKDQCVCKGEGCPNCTIMYTLNKKGPCTVYSRDLEPLGDAKFGIRDPNIPIVKLGEGQALLIYATAVLGRGSEHAKWQTVSGVTFRYYPTIKIDYTLCDNGGGCIGVCPRNIITRADDKVVVGDNFEECILCDACVEVCQPRKGEKKDKDGRKAINVTYDDTRLICNLETDGAINAIDALKESIRLFLVKLNSFSENFKAALEGPVWDELKKKADEEEERREEEEVAAKRKAATEAETTEDKAEDEKEPAEDLSHIPEGDIGIFPEGAEEDESKEEAGEGEGGEDEGEKGEGDSEEPEEGTEPEDSEEPEDEKSTE